MVRPFGDAAVLVDLRRPPGPTTSRQVRAVMELLSDTARAPGWGPPVCGATTLLIPVDPIRPGVAAAARQVETRLAALQLPADDPVAPAAPVVEIPVRYGGPDGPDLDQVAVRTGLTTNDVIRLHASADFSVAFVGFAPGFAYLEPLPAQLRLPRLDQPRTRVPAGSVAIAGPYSAVYPAESPGGWWIIGRTDLALWDPLAHPPARLRPGAAVRFVPA